MRVARMATLVRRCGPGSMLGRVGLELPRHWSDERDIGGVVSPFWRGRSRGRRDSEDALTGQPLVLAHGEAVGHARDVVGHGAVAVFTLGVGGLHL